MKTLYESIKAGTIARMRVNGLPLDLELPPALGDLLVPEVPATEVVNPEDPNAEDDDLWRGSELWRVPSLKPWNSVLLLETIGDSGSANKGAYMASMDAASSASAYMGLHGQLVEHEDRSIAEGLLRFLEIAQITIS
jgi:hypothetical protein